MDNNLDFIVDSDAEREFAVQALKAVSVPDDHAHIVADTLVESDLKGVYSHGIQILPRYIRGLKNGINPTPVVKTEIDMGALATVDGDCGLGQVSAVQSMELAIEKARKHGIASVVTKNTNHLGALAYYGMMAVKAGMFGICCTNGPAVMAPWGGVTETLSNNPICFAAPSQNSYPVVLDMAVSMAARNKIRVAADKGETIPSGWALDRDGNPVTDPEVALEGLLAPMAGAKGFGMAVMIEILTSVLSGGLIGKNVPTDTMKSTDVFYPVYVSHYFQVIDISRLMPIEKFTERVDQISNQVHESELASGTSAVYMPGELEFITREKRIKDGIPLPAAVLSNLNRIASEISIDQITI